MFETDDRLYYEDRAQYATVLGDRAANPKIAVINYEMALRYAILSVQGGPAGTGVGPLNNESESASLEAAPAFSWTTNVDRADAGSEVATR